MTTMMTLDLPVPFHTRALAALDDFEAAITEYTLLLDTQRALLTAGNFDAVIDTLGRGDRIVQRVGRCGRQLAPIREALSDARYTGVRATEIRRRLETARTRAELVRASTTKVASVCAEHRDNAAIELGTMRTEHTNATRGRAAYAPMMAGIAVDVRY